VSRDGIRPSVLFVCLGNICRSPLAEAAFRAEADRIGLEAEVDSAGTGAWHAGASPDRRAQTVARRNGVDISGYRARQVTPADFRRFERIIALDEANLVDLWAIRPADGTATLSLLLDHVPGCAGRSVADPYYGGDEGFEITWAEVTEGARALAAEMSGERTSGDG
jgi:protein-tyrosine phosphatase